MDYPQTRPATADDREFVYQVLRLAFREVVDLIWGWDDEQQFAEFLAEYEPSVTQIVVHQGEDVGFLRVEDRGDFLFLDTIAILPAYQGRGLGGALIGQILSLAAERNLPVQLSILRPNRAKVLYERLGFRIVGGDEHRFYMEARPAEAGPLAGS